MYTLIQGGKMAEYEIGSLVRSDAGHDKDSFFIIIKEDADYVYLADGKTRRFGKLKRKRKKHVQSIHDKDENLQKKLMSGGSVTDEEIKHFIKCWKEKNQGGKTYV